MNFRCWRAISGTVVVLVLPLLGLSPQEKGNDIFSIGRWYGYYRATVETGKHRRIEAYLEVEIGGRQPNMPFLYGAAPDLGALSTKDRFVSWILTSPPGGIPTQYEYDITLSSSLRGNVEGEKERSKNREAWLAQGERSTVPANFMVTLDREKKVYSIRFPWENLFDGSLLVFHRLHQESNLAIDPPVDKQEWMAASRVLPKGPKGFVPVVLNHPYSSDSQTLEGSKEFEWEEPAPGNEKATTKLTVEWSLSPKKFPTLDLVLDADGYNSWRPMGGQDEHDPGNTLRVTAKLATLAPGDLPDECVQIRFLLNGVSHEKGVCINYPPQADPELPFDLQILSAGENKSRLRVQEPFVALETGANLRESAVTVTSFDYGGWGEITARARLKSGRQVAGHRKGMPGEKLLRIPKSKPTSRIAECWNPPGGDALDDETQPHGDGQNGDGLTLYEEYRGFYEGGRWRTIDPNKNKKKLFVCDESRLAGPACAIFEKLTGIEVHSGLLKTELRDLPLPGEQKPLAKGQDVINFNHTDGAHRVDQHGLRIHLSDDFGGLVIAMAQGSPGGPPRNQHDIVVRASPIKTPVELPDGGIGLEAPATWAFTFPRAIVHEMCHSCAVHHHGDNPEDWDGVPWTVEPNPTPSLTSRTEVLKEKGKIIRVWDESSPPQDLTVLETSLVASDMKAGARSVQRMVGAWGGACSGDFYCVMRYNTVFYFASRKDPSVRYKIRHEELQFPDHVVLCESKDGTEQNETSHEPEPHFGPATYGECKHQLLVNDALEPKKR